MKATFGSWSQPSENLSIQENELHVWRADLDLPEAYLESLRLVLSKEELARANRFFSSIDRDRFIVSHACVRNVLSRYLSVEPERISFSQNSFGKPALSTGSGNLNLEFNLTHSHNFALLAVTIGLPVGVDVELIRMDFGGLKIARRFFSPGEYQELRSLPQEEQSEAFFRCWTRKEAFIKAKGYGLTLPLDAFDVSVRTGEPAALISTRNDLDEAVRWSLVQVDPAPFYSGTVAVEEHNLVLRCWDWSPQFKLPSASTFRNARL